MDWYTPPWGGAARSRQVLIPGDCAALALGVNRSGARAGRFADFFSSRRRLRRRDLSRPVRRAARVCRKYPFDFRRPSCICTVPEDDDAKSGWPPAGRSASFPVRQNVPRTRWKPATEVQTLRAASAARRRDEPLGRECPSVAWVRRRQDHEPLPPPGHCSSVVRMIRPIRHLLICSPYISRLQSDRRPGANGDLGPQLGALARRRQLQAQQRAFRTGPVDYRVRPPYPYRPRPPS
jgi:hypothetical protein